MLTLCVYVLQQAVCSTQCLENRIECSTSYIEFLTSLLTNTQLPHATGIGPLYRQYFRLLVEVGNVKMKGNQS